MLVEGDGEYMQPVERPRGDGRHAGPLSLPALEFCSLFKILRVISLKGTWLLHGFPWSQTLSVEHLLCAG